MGAGTDPVMREEKEREREGEEGGEEARDRYSIAYFCHPCRETALVAVPSPLVRESVRRRRGGGEGVGDGGGEGEGEGGNGDDDGNGDGDGTAVVMTAAEHLSGRLAATYGWGKGDGKGKE